MSNVIPFKDPYPHSPEDLDGSNNVLETIPVRNKLYCEKQDGLYYCLLKDNNHNTPYEPHLLTQPAVKVKGTIYDDDNRIKGKVIAYKASSTNEEKLLDIPLISDEGTNAKILLSENGIIIDPCRGSKQHLCYFLQYSEGTYKYRLTNKLGWFHHTYVLPKNQYGKSDLPEDESIYYQNTSNTNFFKAKGTLEEWKTEISYQIRDNHLMVFAISVALAAPLLEFFSNVNSGGFHFYGHSTAGKTTTLKVAASVWGGKSFIHSWKATENGLEVLAYMHNDNVLILDELTEIGDPTKFTNILYMLANGVGKAKCNKNSELMLSKAWKLLLLSTGEISTIGFTDKYNLHKQQGAELRMIDIEINSNQGKGVFENLHEFETAADFGNYLNEKVEEVYGVAGTHYLERLTSNLKENIQIAKKHFAKFMNSIRELNEDGATERVARRFALSAAAGELATSFGITGWKEDEAYEAAMICFSEWHSTYHGKNHKRNVLINELKNYIDKYGDDRFAKLYLSEEEEKRMPMHTKAGYKKVTEFDNNVIYYFNISTMKDICSISNITTNEGVKELLDLDILISGKEKNHQVLIKPTREPTFRGYAIDGNKLTEYDID